MSGVPTPEEAEVIVAAITHTLSTTPVNGARAEVLRRHRRWVRAVATGGFRHETAVVPVSDDLVDVREASLVLGVTTQAITKRCRLGQIPGARQIAGRWAIPASVLPEPEGDPNP